MKISSNVIPPVKPNKVFTLELSEREAALLAGIIGQIGSEDSKNMFRRSSIRNELNIPEMTEHDFTTELYNGLYYRLVEQY